MQPKPGPVTKVFNFFKRDNYFPLLLLLIILSTYGLGMIGLSFQGDDWHLIWLYYRMGDLSPAFNLTRLSTQWLYQAVMPWLAPIPWQWFLLTLVLRWLGGISLYLCVKEIFNHDDFPAGLFAILYCLYPGFLMGYLPLTFLFQSFQPICLFLSFNLMVKWLRSERANQHKWFYLSFILAAANLLLSEYFFLFELLRPLIIQLALRKRKGKPPTFGTIFQKWKPYLILFTTILVLRIWTQAASHERGMRTLERFNLQPATFVLQLSRQVVQDVRAILIQPLQAALSTQLQPPFNQNWLMLGGAGLTGLLVLLYLIQRPVISFSKKITTLALIKLGLVVFILAILPFWAGGLKAYFGFEMLNRTALPQGLAFTLLLAALLKFLPTRWKWLQCGVIVFLATSFTLLQLQSAGKFRAEWEQRKSLMQELAWRAPKLESGTVILINDPGFLLSGENSLSAELNWNYSSEVHPSQAAYFIYFNKHRFLGDLGDIHTDQTLRRTHMIGPTALNPTRLLVLQFANSGCLHVLDPQIDALDKDLNSFTHSYIQDGNLSVIQATTPAESRALDSVIYGAEAAHGWCYYYQKVSLALQLQNWNAAEKFAQQGLDLMPTSVNAVELRPFIEALAHANRWGKVQQLTEAILHQSTSQNRVLCALWQRMAANTTASQSKDESLGWMTAKTGCNFS